MRQARRTRPRAALETAAAPRGIEHADGVGDHVAASLVKSEHHRHKIRVLLSTDDVARHRIEAAASVVATKCQKEVPEVVHGCLVGARDEVQQCWVGLHHLVEEVAIHRSAVVVEPPRAPHFRVDLAHDVKHQLGLLGVHRAGLVARPGVGNSRLEEGGERVILWVDDVPLMDPVFQTNALACGQAVQHPARPAQHGVAQALPAARRGRGGDGGPSRPAELRVPRHGVEPAEELLTTRGRPREGAARRKRHSAAHAALLAPPLLGPHERRYRALGGAELASVARHRTKPLADLADMRDDVRGGPRRQMHPPEVIHHAHTSDDQAACQEDVGVNLGECADARAEEVLVFEDKPGQQDLGERPQVDALHIVEGIEVPDEGPREQVHPQRDRCDGDGDVELPGAVWEQDAQRDERHLVGGHLALPQERSEGVPVVQPTEPALVPHIFERRAHPVRVQHPQEPCQHPERHGEHDDAHPQHGVAQARAARYCGHLPEDIVAIRQPSARNRGQAHDEHRHEHLRTEGARRGDGEVEAAVEAPLEQHDTPMRRGAPGVLLRALRARLTGLRPCQCRVARSETSLLSAVPEHDRGVPAKVQHGRGHGEHCLHEERRLRAPAAEDASGRHERHAEREERKGVEDAAERAGPYHVKHQQHRHLLEEVHHQAQPGATQREEVEAHPGYDNERDQKRLADVPGRRAP
mmetsp:Transcript_11160/g.46474  ORF Transcript_11160/g.46474 Transcript_11160/m.46474 type:complete len:695 (-) Transcript_11160:1507-3591(-)